MYTELIKEDKKEIGSLTPWFNLKRKLESTIGSDSFIKIGEIEFINQTEMEISIIANYNLKAQSLINILVDTYYFFQYKLKIRVFDNEGNEYKKKPIKGVDIKEKLRNNLEVALLTNELVIRILEGSSIGKTWVVEISKNAIQLFDSDSKEIFNNKNYIAEEIYRELIIRNYDDLKIDFTTTLNRNLFLDTASVKTPWLLDYSFIKALFSEDYGVEVMPLYSYNNQYFINIIANSATKAEALATVLNNCYNYNDTDKRLLVRVFNNNNISNGIIMNSESKIEELAELFRLAFYSNNHIKYILSINENMYNSNNTILKGVLIICYKEIIQIFGNSSDFYGNFNILSSEMLEKVLKKTILSKDSKGMLSNINIGTTIEYNRNIIY